MYQFLKRSLDILASALALLILSPVLIPVMIGLKLTGEGYIVYLQERVGYKHRLFHIYKFATMLKDSPNMADGLVTPRRAQGVAPVGRCPRDFTNNARARLLHSLRGAHI